MKRPRLRGLHRCFAKEKKIIGCKIRLSMCSYDSSQVLLWDCGRTIEIATISNVRKRGDICPAAPHCLPLTAHSFLFLLLASACSKLYWCWSPIPFILFFNGYPFFSHSPNFYFFGPSRRGRCRAFFTVCQVVLQPPLSTRRCLPTSPFDSAAHQYQVYQTPFAPWRVPGLPS